MTANVPSKPGFKNILVVVLLKLLPALAVWVFFWKWAGLQIGLPSNLIYWINFAGILLLTRLTAWDLILQLRSSDERKDAE